MEVVGTIFRVIPYTSKYNDETIESVKLTSNTALVGTVAYDRATRLLQRLLRIFASRARR